MYNTREQKNSSKTINYKNTIINENIHRTAIIEDGAEIGDDVKIGPFCYVGKHVKIGDGTELKQSVIVDGYTTIGKNNIIYPFAVIGQDPQDLKFEGEKSTVEIGDNNRIREHCTVHSGTKGDHLITKIGNNNLLMGNTHIAHDCMIGNNCIFANNATLGGHVHVGDFVVIGGMSAIHQKVRIGQHAMIGGMTGVTEDVIPYGVAVSPERASLEGINLVGLKRRNFTSEEMNNLRHFYKEVFLSESGALFDTVEELKEKYKDSETVQNIIEFLFDDTKRQICVKKR